MGGRPLGKSITDQLLISRGSFGISVESVRESECVCVTKSSPSLAHTPSLFPWRSRILTFLSTSMHS